MIEDKYLQVVAHFYRGEMNRLTVYRTRLDTTFQYSILLTSALLVFNLQHSTLQYFPLLILFTLYYKTTFINERIWPNYFSRV